MSTLSERLQKLLRERNISQRELARRSGTSIGTVNGWVSGKTNSIRSIYLPKVASTLGVSQEFLSTGFEVASKDVQPNDITPYTAVAKMIAIPLSNVEFECGDGIEPTYTEDDSEQCYYPLSFFQKAQINPQYCKAFTVLGDSMQPLIHRGDTILVDVSKHQEIQNNYIYAFAIEHSLRVKRLIRKLDKSLIIHSENPDYPDEILSAQEQEGRFFLVGRVLRVEHNLI
jgi:phage repressor protein C with HTH and peptisase S24 domain